MHGDKYMGTNGPRNMVNCNHDPETSGSLEQKSMTATRNGLRVVYVCAVCNKQVANVERIAPLPGENRSMKASSVITR